jgi:alcohol dehydrogenase class IV
MTISRFNFPTPIQFGPKVRFQVRDFLKANGVTRPLVVTDRGVAKLPFFMNFLEHLNSEGVKAQVFSEIWGNPVKSQVTAGVKAFLESKADGIVGIGGGAALDVAKVIGLMATHPGDLFDYEDEKPGARPIDGAIPFWVALPTTAGTGSEVGRSSVISDDTSHLKKIIFSPKLLAKAVFADPETTLDLPASVTASTGMDALTHCVEAFLAKGFHPMCDGIALEGVRLVAENLVRCIKNPQDVEARGGMMMASLMGAVAFQKGLGLTHSCAHALSTVADMHHGLANAVMIDHALRFNLSAVPERFVRLATTVGIEKPTPESFIQWLTQLKATLNIPAKMAAAGIQSAQLEKLTEVAFQDGCHQCNPKAVSRQDFVNIFKESL